MDEDGVVTDSAACWTVTASLTDPDGLRRERECTDTANNWMRRRNLHGVRPTRLAVILMVRAYTDGQGRTWRMA